MKKIVCAFSLLPMILGAAAPEEKSIATRGYPSELARAIRDLQITPASSDPNAALSKAQLNVIRRISYALSGGADFSKTSYTLQDITQIISEDKLRDIALKQMPPLWGILGVLGYQHQVTFMPDDE